jgi:predicted amidohydrolase
MAHQDKQIMTRFEREEWGVVAGGPLQLFDTALGKIGILICYDSEFPLLGRAVAEADLILVPSCTEALTGYSRVRIGSMARALENQCVTVMSSTVGACDWSEAVDENTGMGGIFGPPDTGFPPTGVIAEGVLNKPGWTYADVDLGQIAHVRADGVVLNRRHWDDQMGRDVIAATRKLG